MIDTTATTAPQLAAPSVNAKQESLPLEISDRQEQLVQLHDFLENHLRKHFAELRQPKDIRITSIDLVRSEASTAEEVEHVTPLFSLKVAVDRYGIFETAFLESQVPAKFLDIFWEAAIPLETAIQPEESFLSGLSEEDRHLVKLGFVVEQHTELREAWREAESGRVVEIGEALLSFVAENRELLEAKEERTLVADLAARLAASYGEHTDRDSQRTADYYMELAVAAIDNREYWKLFHFEKSSR